MQTTMKLVKFTSERERLFEKTKKLSKVKAHQWKELAIDMLVPLFELTLQPKFQRILQLLHNIAFVIYKLTPIPKSILSKLKNWTSELMVHVEQYFGPQYVKPKLHMVLHFHIFIAQLGPLSMCDTFQLENLLSKVRRNMHSTVAPEIQGFQLLLTNVTVPIIDEHLKRTYPEMYKLQESTLSSAIDVLMRVEKQEQEWHEAYLGKYLWSLQKPCNCAPTVVTSLKMFFSTDFEIQGYSKAYRKDMIVQATAYDSDQSCTMLSSLSNNPSIRSSRIDCNVLVKYSNNYFVGEIVNFVLVKQHKQTSVFVAINRFDTTSHFYSTDLNEYSKCYFTTATTHSQSIVIPLSCVLHKCDVLTTKKGLTWFH